jgi:hypothetical protein
LIGIVTFSLTSGFAVIGYLTIVQGSEAFEGDSIR